MAYLRFLTNKDYCSIATEEHFSQIIRDVPDRIAQAEQRAEMNMLEHLDQYYEIEKVLAVGKNIREYNVAVSYPAQVFIKKDDEIFKTLTAINGYKQPTKKVYWRQVVEFIDPCLIEKAKKYSQLKMYAKGDIVRFGTEYWMCLIPHGYDAGEIHIPGISAWAEAEVIPWEPNCEWEKDDVCSFNGHFYQYLLEAVEEEEEENGEPGMATQNNEPDPSTPSSDPTNEPSNEPSADPSTGTSNDPITDPLNEPDPSTDPNQSEPSTEPSTDPAPSVPEVLTPEDDDAWGLIGEYSKDFEYDFSEGVRDYVVAEDTVFYPILNPNADELMDGINITRDDPRNINIVAHMSRIALYYLHQLISPTNISETRRWAYEDSMQWLHDAAKFKINPQLPRKRERETGEKKVDWALETYQKSYDPYENAWLI